MSRPINDAKNKLLNCGKELLLQNGYFDLSITKLTHICHMGTGTFYHYFSSKADLVVDIVQADWESTLNSMDNAINDKTSLDGKLRKIYEILKLFNNTYDAIWVQFGAERGNIERFAVIKKT